MDYVSELYVGVDVHERESQVAVYGSDGVLLEERSVRTKRLPKYLSSFPGEKHVGLESVGFIYPVYDALVEEGFDVAVANPNNILLIARTRIKHDRVDARVLGELLRTNFFPRSHIPCKETREKRLLARERVRYGVKRATLKNSIKWLLKRRGVHVRKPFSVVGKEKLRSLGLHEISCRLGELELTEKIVRELDLRIRHVVSGDFTATYPNTMGTKLDSCDTCHITKQIRNPYGEDYATHNYDFLAIEDLDSDRDGYTNIQEINALTYPGDPNDYPAPPVSADLVRRCAWSEHHHFVISKDEDGMQELYAIIKNTGTVPTRVKVVFTISGAATDTVETPPRSLAPDEIYGHKSDARYSVSWAPPTTGRYFVSAQCFYDADANLETEDWTGGTKIKTFSFVVVA